MEYDFDKTTIRMWPDFTKADVEAVINNLRATDVYEATALGEDAEQAVTRCREIVGSTPLAYLAYYGGAPVFLYGVTALNPHHVALWGFGTEDTRKAIPAITRHVRRIWLQELRQAGVSRIEARLPSSCQDSLLWLKSCGMQEECQLLGASVTGEPFSQLSYTWKHPKDV